MTFSWIYVVQWLHILAGITWFGGYIFLTFAVWPALLKRPAAEAKAFFAAIGQPVGTLMMLSGSFVLILGLIRGIVFGPVKSLEFAFTTAYGVTFLVALTLAVVMAAYGAIVGSKTLEKVWDGDNFRPNAAQYIRRSNIFSLLCFGVILACMVLMRFGF
ncbi:MAG: hypothetical protein GC204_06500 [Chloroflexi bacterium]|nr:hypothetical protein [Chloroflexota bacterium]